MKYTSILFDFDGTLANTNGLVLESWKHTFRILRGIEQSDDVIKKTFGEPLGVSMQKFFPKVPVEKAIEVYRGYQKDVFENLIEPFDGMVELVKELKAKGFKTAVTTSRLGPSTMAGLNKFGLGEDFDVVVTASDTTKHKPDPEPVLITLEKLGSKPEEALMIGDSMFDIKCAHNAGVKAVLVGWAEAVTEEDLNGPDRPDYFIEKAEDLFELL
ncbi:MAG: HAD-IA family hydrolase [Firmicutes bacterium]|nr:HAD-IA family hydrolase [Bacillota bacterium]